LEYAKEWSQQTQIKTEINVDSMISLAPHVDQALFRVLQEGLSNVARHSQADWASVTLKKEDHQIALMIEDNGIGYDAERIVKGIGLDSMRERIEAVNGSMEAAGRSPQGSCVAVRVRMS